MNALAFATVIMLSADHEWFVVFQECCGKGENGCCATLNQNGTVDHKTQNGDVNVSSFILFKVKTELDLCVLTCPQPIKFCSVKISILAGNKRSPHS